MLSVPTGRVIFEIGGVPIREELARDSEHILFPQSISSNFAPALRQASNKLPVLTEFITRRSPPRLGSLEIYPPPAKSEDLVDNQAPTSSVPPPP